jgi:hypothetical protein
MRPSGTIGRLFVLSAILGLVILALDQALPTAPTHYYALVTFVVIDFIVGILAFIWPTTGVGRLATVWGALRILIQIADISQATASGFTSMGQFADYLFNPLSSLPQSLGNSPGIPSVPIDLILIIDLIVLVLALRTPKK